MKDSFSRKVFHAVNIVFLCLLAAVTIYPLLFVVAASLSNEEFLMQGSVSIIPKGLTFAAYDRVVTYPMIWVSYRNTIFYTIAGTAVNMFLTICGAFPLSRKRFGLRRIFNFMIIFTMLFNGGLIPTYLVVNGMGMVDTIWAMLLPSAISTWNLIILRSFFSQIPVEIEESALIDGCNEIQTLLRIIIPLSASSIATISLFYAVGHWNSFFNALVYLRTAELYPLQLLLRSVVLQNQANEMMDGMVQGRDAVRESLKYAMIVVATLPILCIYPFIQKYFVKGVMIGSVKG